VAEGARLESVYTGNRIVGSNPTLSANARRAVPDNTFLGLSVLERYSVSRYTLGGRDFSPNFSPLRTA
jgi:hypothetical protein